MVEVIISRSVDHTPAFGSGNPLIHIYAIERHVHGEAESFGTVYGEMKIASGERIWAHELKLNSIEVLNLTPEINVNNGLGYMAQKFVYRKGEYNNYASIDIYDDASTAQTGRHRTNKWQRVARFFLFVRAMFSKT